MVPKQSAEKPSFQKSAGRSAGHLLQKKDHCPSRLCRRELKPFLASSCDAYATWSEWAFKRFTQYTVGSVSQLSFASPERQREIGCHFGTLVSAVFRVCNTGSLDKVRSGRLSYTKKKRNRETIIWMRILIGLQTPLYFV